MRVVGEWLSGLVTGVNRLLTAVGAVGLISALFAWSRRQQVAVPWLLVMTLGALLLASFLAFRRVVAQRDQCLKAKSQDDIKDKALRDHIRIDEQGRPYLAADGGTP
jgi:hypothetical protein